MGVTASASSQSSHTITCSMFPWDDRGDGRPTDTKLLNTLAPVLVAHRLLTHAHRHCNICYFYAGCLTKESPIAENLISVRAYTDQCVGGEIDDFQLTRSLMMAKIEMNR
ncbi:hypothetical protein PoB_002754900 [Plakobranchus ocellatus]|uniref:Uncharacterized protein n=1 Tax=Plakobranchus ocellatus TaxID=259542 RepID=A0AAV4A338_9GAST|nr:hypothetical protein PoB_002754900 [Plakobranchus ocellatus]